MLTGSAKFRQSLRLRPAQSAVHGWLLLGASLLALTSWSLLPLPLLFSLVGTVLIVIAALRAWPPPAAITVIEFHPENGWSIAVKGRSMPVVLQQPVFVSAWAVAMSFTDLQGKSIRCCLFADSVPVDQHRKLRVLLTTLQRVGVETSTHSANNGRS